ncbi:substrate-binding domain-containing protein [Kineosporia sp. NBRC 101731]|uniref:sugar ABC transporter substrate-binding protein n=1 Tax=Kineosporia sp. NBRC 101731 TaxID=3032199 RepID=UPI0024A0754E|nr:substrate-binding domain-containing protein [Kineosporia sp. NBRC 101731]GLY27529.1 sugar ABC transporter substrate-binding protein [Kineosporia sp. NBRC 101731]
MRRQMLAATAIGSAALLTLSACGGDSEGSTTGSTTPQGTVGVILPDAASSPRWENADRPALTEAFTKAGVKVDIQNAGGDKTKFQTIADGMISQGVSALLIVNLDNDSGAAVIKKATDAGVPVIDYDRLTLGGGAKYYVAVDPVLVGTTIGEGLVKCLQDEGTTTGDVVELNGSPTDNNATLFKQGYDKAIRDAGYGVAADQAVPDWDSQKAGTLFEQINTELKGKFVGVAAANDTLGGAVIARLKTEGRAGKVPVTGQDATDTGLQQVLLGNQCVTVYKSINKEAAAAVDLTVKLIKGDTAGADAVASGTVTDTKTNQPVKSVLIEPQAIYADNVQDVIDDGATTAGKVCTTEALKKACEKYGVR